MAKEVPKVAVAAKKSDPRDELLEIADLTIRALNRALNESQDALLTQYYNKRNNLKKELESSNG